MSIKNLRKCQHVASVYESNLMEQNKLLNFQQLLLFPAHSGKVIFWSAHTVPRHTYYFTPLNNEVGFRLCRPANMEVTDSKPSETGSVQLCYRACSERVLEKY